MSRPRWYPSRWVILAASLTAVVLALVTTAINLPSAYAAPSTSVEGESMTVLPANGGGRVVDLIASGGAAVRLLADSTAAFSGSLPESTGMVIRVKGGYCGGWPEMNVTVDGRSVLATKVTSPAFTDYKVTVPIAAGKHTVGVSFTNGYRHRLCVRTLSVDKVTITAAQSGPSGDSTAMLQEMFDALQPGDTLTLDPVVYQHSGVLKLRVSGVRLDGNGATLQATNDRTSSFQVLADNVTVTNIRLSAPLTGPRYDAPDQHKLFVQGDGAKISDVAINGSAAAGVFMFGGSGFVIERVSVFRSRADGIHMTYGANNGRVDNSSTEGTGDDGFAVVSYSNESPCHDIVVTSPTVTGTVWGRGISVVGGNNVSYRNVKVTQTNAAGVYIGSESNTLGVDTVDVTGGTITGANTNPLVVNGAVIIYNAGAGKTSANVTVSGLTITDTPPTAGWNIGVIVDNGTVRDIKFPNISLVNTTVTPLFTSARVPPGSVRATGWSFNGAPISPLPRRR